MTDLAADICDCLLKVALAAYEALRTATSINDLSDIKDESDWIAFDRKCERVKDCIREALCDACDKFLPESTRELLNDALCELNAYGLDTYVRMQMILREAEALRDPNGKYGVMRARRLAMEADQLAEANRSGVDARPYRDGRGIFITLIESDDGDSDEVPPGEP